VHDPVPDRGDLATIHLLQDALERLGVIRNGTGLADSIDAAPEFDPLARDVDELILDRG